jgi:predicted glycoside hydrolase/deacetylase ChbG (UPF0249 family)
MTERRSMTKRLIVNADDFGLTLGVNRAIVACHQRGIVSSTTLMATAARVEDAIAQARQMPELGVGCHVVLVDGEPLLPASEVRSLLAPGTNRFFHGVGDVLRALARGRFRPEEIEAEARAQMKRLQDAGVRLTHFDSHKHTHMFPPILKPVLRAAAAHGVPAVRSAFEPPEMIPYCEAFGSRLLLLRKSGLTVLRSCLHRSWHNAVREAGLATTSGSLGMVSTGSMTTEGLHAMLRRLPPGTWELVCHPGYNDRELDGVRTRLRASREIEMNALVALTRDELRDAYGTELVSFAALAPQADEAAARERIHRENIGGER